MTRFSTIEEIIDFVLFQIDDIPHKVVKSKTTTSVYVHFADEHLGTLTIRDHKNTKKSCRPKWNIVLGYRGKKARDGHYYYNEHDILQCASDLHCALTNRR